MITILVNTPGKATLEFPETEKLPSEYILDVLEHIRVTQSPVIRTLSDSILNLMGHLIEEKIELPEKIYLWVDGEQYSYDEKGVIQWGLFGYFNWFSEEIENKIKEMSPPKSLFDFFTPVLGRRHVLRNGDITAQLVDSGDADFPFAQGNDRDRYGAWTIHGRFNKAGGCEFDIVGLATEEQIAKK